MVLIGRRLSTEELAAVRADPTAVDALLYGDLDDDEAEMPEPELDLDKWWHGIHYLLTGTDWQIGEGAGAAILGGAEIGQDGGYGPPLGCLTRTPSAASPARSTRWTWRCCAPVTTRTP
ncbi:DUF1877 family protein [Micromonospora chersina]